MAKRWSPACGDSETSNVPLDLELLRQPGRSYVAVPEPSRVTIVNRRSLLVDGFVDLTTDMSYEPSRPQALSPQEVAHTILGFSRRYSFKPDNFIHPRSLVKPPLLSRYRPTPAHIPVEPYGRMTPARNMKARLTPRLRPQRPLRTTHDGIYIVDSSSESESEVDRPNLSKNAVPASLDRPAGMAPISGELQQIFSSLDTGRDRPNHSKRKQASSPTRESDCKTQRPDFTNLLAPAAPVSPPLTVSQESADRSPPSVVHHSLADSSRLSAAHPRNQHFQNSHATVGPSGKARATMPSVRGKSVPTEVFVIERWRDFNEIETDLATGDCASLAASESRHTSGSLRAKMVEQVDDPHPHQDVSLIIYGAGAGYFLFVAIESEQDWTNRRAYSIDLSPL
ncbi:hypothetical protein DFJ77DRAFT_436724 [Powellomyces hirtus]|nr:hypothetical protein DFJ77DRAFT_436724 [Powellomyces hirtus]